VKVAQVTAAILSGTVEDAIRSGKLNEIKPFLKAPEIVTVKSFGEKIYQLSVLVPTVSPTFLWGGVISGKRYDFNQSNHSQRKLLFNVSV